MAMARPATAIVPLSSTENGPASESPSSPGVGDHQRRRKISERAKELFKKKVLDRKESSPSIPTLSRRSSSPSEIPREVNLPYQPRMKPAPAISPSYGYFPRRPSGDVEVISFEGVNEQSSSSSLDARLQSVMPSTKRASTSGNVSFAPSPRSHSPDPQPSASSRRGSDLSPLLIDESVTQARSMDNAGSPSADKTPTVTRSPTADVCAPLSSPHTPRQPLRKLSMSRDKEGPQISPDAPPTRSHFHLHRPRLPHPSRKSSVDVSKRVARGQMNLHDSEHKQAPRPPGSFPVAPSYHPNAHPTSQPPRVAFNIIDGPTSRNPASAAEAVETGNPTPGHTLPPPQLQRPAIKIKIITWNMGGASLPKGDLEVLLGRVGGYIPPDEGWDLDYESDSDPTHVADKASSEKSGHIVPEEQGQKGSAPQRRGKGIAGQEDVPRHDRIPPLPHDDGHPYHLLIVAGQECPWGDGKRIATGLGVAGELGDLTRTKSKAQPSKASKEVGTPSIAGTMDLWSPGIVTPKTFGADEFPFGSPPQNIAAGGVPAPVPHSKGLGGKGWSEACEDWLCRGPAAQTQATKGLAATAEALVNGKVPSAAASQVQSRTGSPEPPRDVLSQSGRDLPSANHSDDFESLSPMGGSPPRAAGLMSGSSRGRRTSTSGALAVPQSAFGRSNSTGTIPPLSQPCRTGSSSGSSSATTAADTLRVPSPTPPIVKDFAAPGSPPQPQDAAAVREGARRQLHLQIPGQQFDNPPHTIGAYELIAKERMAMVYCAVYVWRGCRDRVRGVSRGQVKSGLLAGRVGNKGAVGISVKLGRTRLLFVNSHLAAHEGKVQTRLDNIAKIKRELRLDTFLPTDDARNRLDDVTEMFDHAFWLGDLNFRVDITRQHADWLLMQRRYDQAIEFDQLRKVMKEGKEFKGFQEHPITFPPTYKYDVLKTLKKPKKERTVRRILQRRGHAATNLVTSPTDTADDPDLDSPIRWEGMSGGETSGTASGNISSTHRQEQVQAATAQMVSERERERGDYTDDDASSVSSAAWDSSGFVGQVCPDSDEDSSMFDSSHGPSPVDPVVSSNTSAAQGGAIFSHGAAIKAKLRIIDLVRSATGGHSDQSAAAAAAARRREKHRSREISGGPLSQPTTPKSERYSPNSPGHKGELRLQASPRSSGGEGSGGLTRRLSTKAGSSVPTFTSQIGENALRNQSSFASLASDQYATHNIRPVTSPAAAAFMERRQSSAGDGEIPLSGLQRSESNAARLGTAAEIDEQKYDTSAKQRVPSWTDRILWRSNVPVVPVEPDSISGKMSKSLSAIKAAAVSASSRTTQRVPLSKEQLTASRTNSSIPLPKRSQTYSHPVSYLDRKIAEQEAGESDEMGLFKDVVPQRGRGGTWFHWHGPPKGDGSRTSLDLSDGQTLGELAMSRSASISSTRTAVRARDSAKHFRDLSTTADTASADGARPRMPTTPKRTASAGHTSYIARPSYSRGPLSSPRLSALRAVSSPYHDGISGTRTVSPSPADAAHEEGNDPSTQIHGHPLNRGGVDGGAVRTSNGNADLTPPNRRLNTSWWSTHMPSILTAHGAAAALASFGGPRDVPPSAPHPDDVDDGSVPPPLPPKVELLGPMRGEVECLLYKSLDDREMRALEGRSDHRPVIWVGSCGV